MDDKKYQIFISSTYTDLKEARSKIIETILNLYHFPIGMEMFSANDADQWKVIQETIDQSDYYIIIIGHRYGSVTPQGISYTEKEYNYAKKQKVPILTFVQDRDAATKPDEREEDNKKKEKLKKFVKKTMKNKMVRVWKTTDELARFVSEALFMSIRGNPRVGWIRADKALTPEISEELVGLSKENRELRTKITTLESRLGKKKPSVDLEINGIKEIKLILDETLLEKAEKIKLLKYEDVPGFLTAHVLKEHIDQYNAALPSEETVKNYNRDLIAYHAHEKFSLNLKLKFINSGEIPLNELNIDVDFPPEIKVFEAEAKEKCPCPKNPFPINPISDEDFLKSKLQDLDIDPSIFQSQQTIPIQTKIPKLKGGFNLAFWSGLGNNSILLYKNKLIPTISVTFDEYSVVPTALGNFKVSVKIVSEEITIPTCIEIPITVERMELGTSSTR